MQFYKDGFRGGNPDIKRAAPNRRNRGTNEPLPEKVDVLIAGTGPAGLCLAAQLARFPEIDTMIVERMPSNIIKGKADGINTRTMEIDARVIGAGLGLEPAQVQALMQADRPVHLATPTEQMPQRNLGFEGFLVQLRDMQEQLDRLVRLFVQQIVQAAEIRGGQLADLAGAVALAAAAADHPAGQRRQRH